MSKNNNKTDSLKEPNNQIPASDPGLDVGTQAEVDEIISWLTGYDMSNVDINMNYGDFFDQAPNYNPRAELITGSICGVKVEMIEDPLMKKIRQLDKLVDELAKGKPMEKIKR